jgi:glucose/arabinose dehydrogenase
MRFTTVLALALLTLGGCSGKEAPAAAREKPFKATPVASFYEPWAMTFLPDGRLLVTERAGRILIVTQDGKKSAPLGGVPKVAYAGQGGLMDIVLHPDFANNHYIYISYAEPGENGLSGTALARATLADKGLENLQVIWRQEPKVSGDGHFSGRIAFSPDGYMFVTSGERQKFSPAQDMNQNLGEVIRLTDTGMIPSDNPFYGQGRLKAQLWSYGHRNLLGIAFDKDGRLWEHEMGPRGGDEFNLIRKGGNYGWPEVSEGRHYGGTPIPPHSTRPDIIAPKASWNPVISPAGLIIYSGDMFPNWKGSALIGGLSSESLVRVAITGDTAKEAERFDMGKRIREVEQGPDGAVWLLEDKAGGRLLKLTPIAAN